MKKLILLMLLVLPFISTVSASSYTAEVQVGQLYYPGNIIEAIIITRLDTQPVNSSLVIDLMCPNKTMKTMAYENLTGGHPTGVYKTSYFFGNNTSVGLYTIYVNASYGANNTAGIGSFLVSRNTTGLDGYLDDINTTVSTLDDDIATLETDINSIQTRIDEIFSITRWIREDTTELVNNNFTITGTVDGINGTLIDINETLLALTTKLDKVRFDVDEVKNTLNTETDVDEFTQQASLIVLVAILVGILYLVARGKSKVIVKTTSPVPTQALNPLKPIGNFGTSFIPDTPRATKSDKLSIEDQAEVIIQKQNTLTDALNLQVSKFKEGLERVMRIRDSLGSGKSAPTRISPEKQALINKINETKRVMNGGEGQP